MIDGSRNVSQEQAKAGVDRSLSKEQTPDHDYRAEQQVEQEHVAVAGALRIVAISVQIKVNHRP